MGWFRLMVSVMVALSFLSGCSSSSSAPECKGASQACGAVCVDVRTDNQNCGACGAACGAGTACSAGACAATCAVPLSLCGTAAAARCVDLQHDPGHCGTCGITCGGGSVCVAGACATSCPSPQIVCGGKCVDPSTDQFYCGASGTCGVGGGSAGQSCGTTGSCVASVCQARPAVTSFTGPAAFTVGKAGLTLQATFSNGSASVAGCTPATAAASPATFACPAIARDTTYTLTVASSTIAGATDAASLIVVAAPDPALATFAGPGASLAPGGVASFTGQGCAGCAVTFSTPLVIDTGSTAGAFTAHLATAPTSTTTVTMSVVNAAGDSALLSATAVVVQPAVLAFSGPAAVTSGGAATLTASYSPSSATATVLGCTGGVPSGTNPTTQTFTCPGLVAATDFDLAVKYGTLTVHAPALVHVAVVPAPTASSLTAAPSSVALGSTGNVTLAGTFTGASATITGGGVSAQVGTVGGPFIVSVPAPQATTTYTLTASNAAGSTAATTATVLVAESVPAAALTGLARYGAASVILPNGKVLVVGGSTTPDGLNPVNSAQVYDPVSGTWNPAVAMFVARYRPTAVLLTGGLNPGKVLVAGGANSKTIELFDPLASGGSFFVSSQNMAVARCGGHAAVEVTAGVVVLAGGSDCAATPTDLRSVEFWDGTGMTDRLPPNGLTLPRRGLTATLLGNGRVLFAGGSTFNATADVMTYGAVSLTFASVSFAGTTLRQFHTATPLANGTVLVAGGSTATADTAEIYDPAAGPNGTFSLTSSELVTDRSSHAAVRLPSGLVLLIGGQAAAPLSTTEFYDPATRRFASGPTLANPRQQLVAAPLAGGLILVAGGADAVAGASAVEQLVAP